MLKSQIGVEGTGPRKTFWFRYDLHRDWQGPILSYEALAAAILRSGAGHFRQEWLEGLIERSPRGGSTKEFVIVVDPIGVHPFQEAAGRGFARALGIKSPRADPGDLKAVNALLDVLGESPKSIRRSLSRNPRKGIIIQMHTKNPMEQRIAITGVFREQKLRRLSTARAAQNVDFCGDFSKTDFSNSRFIPTNEIGGPVLSGRFVGAEFTRCEFVRAQLAGDFAKASLSNMAFRACDLTGRFDGADMQNAVMTGCDVGPGATFRGADLRGARLCFRNENQIRAARVGPEDVVGVCTDAVDLCGCRYILVKPAQQVQGVRVVDNRGKALSQWPTLSAEFLDRFMRAGLLCSQDGVDMLLDISNIKITCTEEASMSTAILRLNAPGTVFFRLPDSKVVKLLGNYSNARFDECRFGELNLSKGSFRHLDLTRTEINWLILSMTNTDLLGLRLPRRVESNVCFKELGPHVAFRRSFLLNTFRLPAELAQMVLDVWDSASGCERLARQLFIKAWKTHAPEWLNLALEIILCRRGTTAAELAGRLPEDDDKRERLLTQEVVAAFNLIARRNRITQCTVATPG